MILKRELYDLLPWWSWLRMRARLHWSRMTGGIARQLGVRGQATEVLESLAWGARPRAIPTPTNNGIKAELIAAAKICPTRAFEVDEAASKVVLRRRACVLCGLCYFVAPNSLVGHSSALQAFPPGADELTDFPWA